MRILVSGVASYQPAWQLLLVDSVDASYVYVGIANSKIQNHHLFNTFFLLLLLMLMFCLSHDERSLHQNS